MSDIYRDLVVTCGRDVADAVLRTFGGMEIYVPVKWSDNTPINAIGESHARALIEKFGHGKLTVPRSHLSKRERTRLIKKLAADGGMTVNEIARFTGCTSRWVRHILNGTPADDRQPTLF